MQAFDIKPEGSSFPLVLAEMRHQIPINLSFSRRIHQIVLALLHYSDSYDGRRLLAKHFDMLCNNPIGATPEELLFLYRLYLTVKQHCPVWLQDNQAELFLLKTMDFMIVLARQNPHLQMYLYHIEIAESGSFKIPVERMRELRTWIANV